MTNLFFITGQSTEMKKSGTFVEIRGLANIVHISAGRLKVSSPQLQSSAFLVVIFFLHELLTVVR
jgi:hypothetical protein